MLSYSWMVRMSGVEVLGKQFSKTEPGPMVSCKIHGLNFGSLKLDERKPQIRNPISKLDRQIRVISTVQVEISDFGFEVSSSSSNFKTPRIPGRLKNHRSLGGLV